MSPLLTTKQLAALLNVTTRTIENYCRRRLIPFVRIPAGRRFDQRDVERFIAARKFSHQG